MHDSEKPRTPEEIRKTNKERNREEIDLSLAGAEVDENDRLVVTERQRERARRDMEYDLKHRDQKKQQVQEKILGIENVLGQPISEESKKMIIQNESESADTKPDVIGKNKIESNSDNIEKEIIYRILSGEFKDSLMQITNVLKVRERKRLDSLINPDATPYLESCVKDLNSITTTEGIKNSISKITKVIKSIGEVPKQRGINDSTEDLKIAGNALGRFKMTNDAAGKEIAGLKDEKTKEILEQMHFLDEVLKEKLSYMSARIVQLENYLGR